VPHELHISSQQHDPVVAGISHKHELVRVMAQVTRPVQLPHSRAGLGAVVKQNAAVGIDYTGPMLARQSTPSAVADHVVSGDQFDGVPRTLDAWRQRSTTKTVSVVQAELQQLTNVGTRHQQSIVTGHRYATRTVGDDPVALRSFQRHGTYHFLGIVGDVEAVVKLGACQVVPLGGLQPFDIPATEMFVAVGRGIDVDAVSSQHVQVAM